MNTKRAASVRLGALFGALFLVSAALILASGCGSSSFLASQGRNIYVIQGGAVSVFPVTANGNVAPTTTITGGNTGLNDAHRAAFDSTGKMYVTNAANSSITVYAAGATGNATPTATISGANTGLGSPSGIAIDATNKIYVSNTNGPNGNRVLIFAAGTTGNVAPTATISGAATGLDSPNGLDLDGSGNIYVVNETGNSVTVYPPSATGNVAPTATISGAATLLHRPHAIAVDKSGNFAVTNSSPTNSVTIFAAGANGNVAPSATISGAATLLANPNGIAHAHGNLYIANGDDVVGGTQLGDNLVVFPDTANGNVAPSATITGAATGLGTNGVVHGITVF